MRQLLFAVGLGLFCHGAIAQADTYRIEITIKEGNISGKVFLRYFTPNGPVMDSAMMENGKSVLTGKLPSRLTIARIMVRDDRSTKHNHNCEVWLEKGTIKIEAKKEFSEASYSGSSTQEQFGELQEALRPVKKKNNKLDEKYEEAEAKKDAAAKDQLVNEAYPALFKEKQAVLGAFIRKYPGSLISAYQFDDFAGEGEMDLAVVEPVYDLLPNAIKKLPQVEKVAERIAINKRTAPGMEAPAFSQTDTSGKQISLSSFHGKYVLVDFWAGWCVPCRAENPLLRQLYQQYSHKGFEILGVSLGGERKRWTDAIRDDKLMRRQVSDLQIFDNSIARQYGVNSIPQNILIGPDGKIIAKNLRGSALEEKLATLFK